MNRHTDVTKTPKPPFLLFCKNIEKKIPIKNRTNIMKISLNVCRKKNCTYVKHLILHECNYEDVYYSILFIGISCITQWYMHVFSISDNLTSQPLGTLEDSRKLTTCTTHFTQYFIHTYYTLIHTHRHTHTTVCSLVFVVSLVTVFVHQDRDVGVVNQIITDAPHQRPPELPQTTWPGY